MRGHFNSRKRVLHCCKRSIGAPLVKTTEKTLLKSQDACPLTQESSEIKKLQQADVNKLNFVLPSSDITEIHLNMCNP